MSTDSNLETEAHRPKESSLLLAIAALLADSHRSRNPKLADELSATLLLDAAGLNFREIAVIIGKQPAAVRMSISRAKKNNNKGTEE